MENVQTAGKQLLALASGLLDSALRKEGEFGAAHLHPDFVFISPRAVVMQKDSFLRDFVLNPAVQMDAFHFTESSVVVAAGTAVVHGTIRAKFQDKEAAMLKASVCLSEGVDGWKVLSMQETYIP